MKKTLMLCAALCAMMMFAACTEKDNGPVEPAPIGHNPLYHISYEGTYSDSGEHTYDDGTVYTWTRSYIIDLEFLTDTTVKFHGVIWLSDNSYYKEIRQVGGWNDTLRYSFAGNEGSLYGKNESVWRGDQNPIRLGTNDSLQIYTRQKGFVSLAKAEE